MNVDIILKNTDNSEMIYDKILSFSFHKDSYQSYTSLGAKFSGNLSVPENVSEIIFRIDDKTVHHGLADNISVEFSGGNSVISVSSRSFTSLLIQNQIETGLKSDISINSLMNSYYNLPYVTHEDSSQKSYIFVKSNSNMWDGIVNLSYKIHGTYPYIRDTNYIRMTPVENPSVFEYNDNDIISRGISTTGRKLTSHFHMSDLNGDFGEYEFSDNDIISHNIIRHRFFELDRQFLYNPKQALEYRSAYSSRGRKKFFCTYSGYNGEDLSDIITFGDVVKKRVNSVTVTGNSSGIITETAVYNDKFFT
ncbi:MAG: hypothetical protein K2H28_02350 [Ruminococcus sp.]|nr:hypothetical protein [Ruminococcus sp.]